MIARNVVSTSQPLATQAGIEMLRIGGNAVDAALAAAIALVVVEPTGNGLGSDAFAIVWDGQSLHGLNASGRSPAGWTRERFAKAGSVPYRGFESVTVPGAVSAWADLSERFGALPFRELFRPAIQYAEDGFHVSPIIAELWRRGAAELSGQPGFAMAFMPGGQAPLAGELFRFPDMAASLRKIASSKGRAFYEGELAESLAAYSARHGAALTQADLAAHRNEFCGTISQRFCDIDVHEIPPNGQGIAALMALGILDRLGLAELKPDRVEALHLQIEATKLALADLGAYIADPAAMEDIGYADLLNPSYLDSRAGLVSRRRAQIFGAGSPRDGGTVYLCTGDRDGRMVSFIQSNYAGFGSGVVVPGTGISLQNRGAGFTLAEDHPNCVGPSKRPFHTIIPGFVMRNGEPLMSFGLMGGPMQAQGHVQVIARMFAWAQDPQSASDAPRWRFIDGLKVALEPAVGENVASGLAALGHDVTFEMSEASFGFGGAQIVCRHNEGYVCGSDPRKDGHAAGF